MTRSPAWRWVGFEGPENQRRDARSSSCLNEGLSKIDTAGGAWRREVGATQLGLPGPENHEIVKEVDGWGRA